MTFRTPCYYRNFTCIADKCTDNCCIGWEIEIDSDTAGYYKSLEGDFGKRLRESISDEDTFILKGERCPFLNESKLCDIIINCGENALCQICRDHPRFFNWYADIKEGGIGLSCEEGARLVLTTDSVSYYEEEIEEENEEVDTQLFSFLMSCRESIFSVIDRENVPVSEAICEVLDFAQKLQFIIDNPHLTQDDYSNSECEAAQSSKGNTEEVLRLFGEFEPIDSSWSEELSRLAERVTCFTGTKGNGRYVRNIFRYFIYRYFLSGVFDGEILSKVKFAAVSAVFISVMTDGESELHSWIEKSKLYSKQMEYSDENRELFYDMSYEKACFALSEIKELVRTIL